MKKLLISAAVFAGSLSNFAAAADTDVVATVNGKAITNEVFTMYGKKRIGVPPDQNLPAAKRKELIQEMINRELIYQDALNNDLDKDEFVIMQMQEQMQNIMTRYQINKLLENNPPSAKMLEEIYQSQIVAPASKEYKARHILLREQDDANAVILELNKGANFEKLAAEKSTGPSASQGGDLGWFAPNQMVKTFAEAVEKLKPGEYTKRAVQTRFGWHVIKLEEARAVEPPPFESVKDQVLKVAQNKIINDYIDGLKSKAEISIK